MSAGDFKPVKAGKNAWHCCARSEAEKPIVSEPKIVAPTASEDGDLHLRRRINRSRRARMPGLRALGGRSEAGKANRLEAKDRCAAAGQERRLHLCPHI